MVDAGLTQQEYHEAAVLATLDNNDNNRLSNDISDGFDGLVDADFESEEETHPAISSLRGQQPVSEFDSTDQVISTSFPHVFLLGHAYK